MPVIVAITPNLSDGMTPKQEQILRILQEECGEVVSIVSKCCRFGFDSKNPDSGKANQELLTQEVGDVLAMIELLIDDEVLSADQLCSAKARKIQKLHKYSTIFTVTDPE